MLSQRRQTGRVTSPEQVGSPVSPVDLHWFQFECQQILVTLKIKLEATNQTNAIPISATRVGKTMLALLLALQALL